MLGFIFIIFVFFTFKEYWNKLMVGALGFMVVLFGTNAIAASYSLGPNTGTVSVDEYQAMNYIWEQEQTNDKHCVVAGTYPLLALEALSGRKIIGGGFPIDHNFAQPELNAIAQAGMDKLNPSAIERAIRATGSDHCYVLLPTKSSLSQHAVGRVVSEHFNTVDVRRFNKNDF
jgi:hypothetical protein